MIIATFILAQSGKRTMSMHEIKLTKRKCSNSGLGCLELERNIFDGCWYAVAIRENEIFGQSQRGSESDFGWITN